MANDGSASQPKASIALDNYGDAARQLLRARTAFACAGFLLNYLKPGMSLLDCGCGEGTITVDLAAIVAPGRTVGIDMARAAIERARQLALERGQTNLRFESGSVYALPFADASFDVVFSHALFEHLTDRPQALAEIKRVLKPGGLVALRSPDNGAIIVEPPDPDIEQFWQLITQIRDELSAGSKVGRQLPTLLHQAGFSRVIGSASFECYGTPESVKWIAHLYGDFALHGPYPPEWLARGWADQATLERINAAWHAWAEQPGALFAWGWGAAVGRKS
jgi:ubiquinone/menaquinone biosynthesis C-methylase UbiE